MGEFEHMLEEPYSSCHVTHQVSGMHREVLPHAWLGVPTRSEALLDLLLTNRQNLFRNISVSDSLDDSDHNIVVFGIWLSMLEATTETKTVELRRAHFSSLRAQLREIHGG